MFARRSSPLLLLGLSVLGLFGSSIAQSTIGDGYHCESAGPNNWTNTLTTSVLASTGKNLSAYVTITESETVYTVKHGDDLIYTHRGSGTAENATVETTFGPNTWSGISSMISRYAPSEQILRGSIDGQEIAPYKKDATSAIANAPKLANGQAAPTAKQIANLTAADFQSLNEKVKSIPKHVNRQRFSKNHLATYSSAEVTASIVATALATCRTPRPIFRVYPAWAAST